LRLVIGILTIYLLIGLILFPIALGNSPSITFPATLAYERLSSLERLPNSFSLAGDEVAVGQIGRDYRGTFEFLQRNPIFGVGLGNYIFAAAEYTGSPVQSTGRGIYLLLLAELGIIGTSIFLSFLGYVLWRLGRAMAQYKHHPLRPFAVASLLSIVGVMIASADSQSLTTDSYLWVMLAIGLAIPTIMRKTTVANGAHPVNGTQTVGAEFPRS